MINTGVYGFSIARAVISGNLDFNIANFWYFKTIVIRKYY
jgi:hypothetical protein